MDSQVTEKTECPFCHTIPTGGDVACGSQIQARGCAWLTTALLRQPKRPFGTHDPIEKLKAERDYSVKARLMAEKDLEMALIDGEELRGLLREACDELNVVASYKDDPAVNAGLRSTARAYDRLVMRIDAALKGGEEGGDASKQGCDSTGHFEPQKQS